MRTDRRLRGKRARLLFPALFGLLVWSTAPAFALPQTSTPTLELDRTIQTTPFVGTAVSMKDHEGSAFVPSDNSLWLSDDNANAIYEIDPTTGALKRTINRAAFNNAPKFGGGPIAGTNRTDDFESLAYDEANDQLFLFAGPCCTSTVLPTAFRLTRQGGSLEVESYQPLAAGANYTSSAWNSADQAVYVGVARRLHTYHYETNTVGPTFRVPDLAGILGMVFSPNGADLFVVTNAEALKRVDWATKTLVPGWTFDLTPFDVRDSRGVELIDDQLYVSDGADSRPAGPLKFAVFVFSVLGPAPVAPTASFTANPSSGAAPLSVTFDNTSMGSTPMTWAWDFDEDNVTDSAAKDPTHVFDTPDTYTVELTATNSVSSSTTTRDVVVSEPEPSQGIVGNPGFEIDTAGWGTTGSGAGVALTRVTSPVHGGVGAALLRNNATGARRCVLNDSPNWVTTTQAGLYTGSIWVRADEPGALIKVNFRELDGTTLLRSRTKTYTLTTSWQLVNVTHTPLSPGSSTLDLRVFVPRAYAPPGVCFYADDASIAVS
ncbi:MAG: PKD domain-containing protein [Actinomycetota bacterium]|nr:PKD domain-containing protein [Actinomycetota bacterium]